MSLGSREGAVLNRKAYIGKPAAVSTPPEESPSSVPLIKGKRGRLGYPRQCGLLLQEGLSLF